MSVSDILKKIHPRTVIWFLLVALFCLIAFVGKHYNTRLEALEGYKAQQNGHLRDIDVKLGELGTDIKWIRERIK